MVLIVGGVAGGASLHLALCPFLLLLSIVLDAALPSAIERWLPPS